MAESIFSLGSNESEDILQNFQIIAHFGRITIPLLTARYFFYPSTASTLWQFLNKFSNIYSQETYFVIILRDALLWS